MPAERPYLVVALLLAVASVLPLGVRGFLVARAAAHARIERVVAHAVEANRPVQARWIPIRPPRRLGCGGIPHVPPR